MRYLKLYENFDDFDINEICEKYGIKNYTVNDDGSIDVNGTVNLANKYLTEIPLKFRNVTGDFLCNNNELTSLKNSPEKVNNFYCASNKLTSLEFHPISVNKFSCIGNLLTSLEFCPDVNGAFYINDNQLTSLKGCPEFINGDFYCSSNKLTSLEFMPKIVNGDLYCNNNNLINFKGYVEPFGEFFCYGNPVSYIWELFYEEEYIELLNDYDCIRDKDIIIDRLNQFLEEIDKPTVKYVYGYNNI